MLLSSDTFSDKTITDFTREIKEIKKEADKIKDHKADRGLARISRYMLIASILFFPLSPGYVLGWLFFGLYISMRWALTAHHELHNAFGNRKTYARGWRRYFEWFDLLDARSWDYEHNKLHHSYTNTSRDPDFIPEMAKNDSDLSLPFKLFVYFSSLIGWKMFYYSPNIYGLYNNLKKKLVSVRLLNAYNFYKLRDMDFTYYTTIFIPYVLFYWIMIPYAYSVLGFSFRNVILNILISEVWSNIHTFMIIVTNHHGDDLYYFDEKTKCNNFFLRQIISSCNFETGNDYIDYFYGGLNLMPSTLMKLLHVLLYSRYIVSGINTVIKIITFKFSQLLIYSVYIL